MGNQFRFGNRSMLRLVTCHCDIQSVMNLAIKKTEVDFFIAEGKRSKSKQDQYFMTGASKLKYPNSYHNEPYLSLAVDVVPYVNNLAVWAYETPDERDVWDEVTGVIKEVANELGIPLDWGFDLWSWDCPHWQLTTYRT